MAHNSTGKEELREGVVDARSAREHFKAAGAAAAEEVNKAAANARVWAGDQFAELQDEIELRPHRAALFALGIGVFAGILLGALLRPERS